MPLVAHRQAIETWLRALPLRRQVWDLLCGQSTPVYLVGGSVRDALLARASLDLDFAAQGNALALARRIADTIGGAYVPLDPDRNVGRVIIREGHSEQHVDLASLRAPDILADLKARDLTINAMAIQVQTEPGELLDPTGGRTDLQSGVLRAASSSAFADDPIRILRALRLYGALGFGLAPDTEKMVRQLAHRLAGVAPERLRDEIYNILGLDQAAHVLRYGKTLGVLDAATVSVLQGGASAHGLSALAALEDLHGLAGTASGLLLEAEGCLAPWRDRLMQHWREPLTHGRRRWEALKLATLLTSGVSQEEARALAKQLKLSNREGRFLALSLEAARQIASQSAKGPAAPLDVYRTFRDVGQAGPDGCLIALVEQALEMSGAASALRRWDSLVDNTGRFLRAWYDPQRQLVDPPRLLTGGDLVMALGIAQGPRVGWLLEAIREAQVQGLVSTRDEALAYAARQEGP